MKILILILLSLFTIYPSWGQISNDVCSGSINLPVDGACRTYSNVGATASSDPTDGLNCGYGNAGQGDLWFSSIVPASGNVTIETSQPTAGGLDRMDVEVYNGTCSTLSILSCSSEKERFNNYDGHARVELEGLAAGSIIYIRAIAPYGNTGDFDICVTDMGYNYLCRIDYIATGTQGSCDPSTNTYSQEFTVYYRTDGSPNMMSIMDTSVMLTGSPQTVMVNNLAAHGASVDVYADLHFNYEWTICRAESVFRGDEMFMAPVNCYSGDVANDDCTGAITLSVGSECIEYIGDNTGATLSSGVNQYFDCYYAGDTPQDVWYNFIVPQSGDIVINTYQVSPYNVSAVFEIYEGICGSLNLLQPSCGINYNSIRTSGHTPGDTLYIRVADASGDDQGEFGICVFEPEPFTNDICADAIELPVGSQSNGLVFTTHYATAESHPTAIISCDNSSNVSQDVWFKVLVPSSGQLSIQTEEVERGYSDMLMEVYSGTCGTLSLISCDNNSGDNGHSIIDLSNRITNETLYVRVSYYGSYHKSSFGISAIALDNDVCSGSINLPVDGACRTYSNVGATASNTPTSGISCGYQNSTDDVWFETIVPSSGHLTIEALSLDITRVFFEVYTGSCSSLSTIECSATSTFISQTSMVVLENRIPNEMLWIRVVGSGLDTEGSFDICISDRGKPCAIDSIVEISSPVCDPLTNSSTHSLQVYYRTDGSVTHVSIFSESYELTGSPLQLNVELPANGGIINTTAQLLNESVYNECSAYTEFDFSIQTAPNCYSGTVPNDDCIGAIELDINSTCDGNIFSNTGATLSSGFGINNPTGCWSGGPNTQDVWFKVTVPQSGILDIIEEYLDFQPRVEVYSGSCTNLIFETCYVRNFRFTPNQTIYLRIFDNDSNMQGDFGLCVESLCPDNETIVDTLSDVIRYEDHIKISADNVILSSADVVYDAGQCIEFHPGFEVNQGALFEAVVDGCFDDYGCPLRADFFTGDYKISYIGDASAGFGLPFDTSDIINVLVPPINSNGRYFDVLYFPQFSDDWIISISLDFSCDQVFSTYSNLGIGCGNGGIEIVGAHISEYNIISSYDPNDDSELIIHFIDYYEDGGCGVPAAVKTMKLTKTAPDDNGA